MRKACGLRFLTFAGVLAVLGPVPGARAQDAVMLGLAPAARAEDEAIPVDRLPGAVVHAAKARFPGAKLLQASAANEAGATAYALKLKHARRDLVVTLKGDGTVVLVETAVSRKQLPRAVFRAVTRLYPDASITSAGAFRKGPEVGKAADYYEVYLLSAEGRPRWIRMDPRGRVLEDPFRRLRRARSRPPLAGAPGPAAP
ncbi:MAG TPA: hypothetical protein VG406_07890 [Isosphaeraceae bacterium]|jgi:hypothetical protein|nr:hypothetical protein [Isosphaeraceae bacterium]